MKESFQFVQAPDILIDLKCSKMSESDEDYPRDACGVFGCVLTDWSSPLASTPTGNYSKQQSNYVPYTIYLGLVALQHRGQESAGIVTSDGAEDSVLKTYKGHGLVSSIFSEENLSKLHGNIGIGHTRYSTSGGHCNSNITNVQPFVVHTNEGPVAVAHNGELVNAKSLRDMVYSKGVGLSSLSDSELITQTLCLQPPDCATPNNWPDRIKRLMHLSPISYSLAILHNDAIYAVRDPHGNRPLCIGRIVKNNGYMSRSSSFHQQPTPVQSNPPSRRGSQNSPNNTSTPNSSSSTNGFDQSSPIFLNDETEAWIVSSESCAFRAVGAEFVREVEPGELVEVSSRGLKSCFPLGKNNPSPSSLCIFEYVYFSRADSFMEGQQIWNVRKRCGMQLAKEAPCKTDLVSTVPESATPAALGFAEACGIPFTEVFCKNRYVGRTFIQPTTQARKIGIAKKFGLLSDNVRGKSIVIVDDSIVRGTTIGPIVSMLKSAGATEVHIRIASPPIKYPCRMGIHIPTKSELIANTKDAAKLAEEIGAASLRYLSVEGLVEAVSSKAKACPLSAAHRWSTSFVSLTQDLNGLKVGDERSSPPLKNGESAGQQQERGASPCENSCSDVSQRGYCTACLTGKYPVSLDW